jgi:hypothetical protein
MNNTHRAIDLIPKDVLICDWHYERADKTAAYFAMKGLRVVTSPWRTPQVATQQVKDMYEFRASATPALQANFQGIVQTHWSGAENFMDGFYGKIKNETPTDKTPWDCFRTIFPKPVPARRP